MQTPEPSDSADVSNDRPPLAVPPDRTRDFSTDDLEVDFTDPNLDLTYDENQREDDAHPERD